MAKQEQMATTRDPDFLQVVIKRLEALEALGRQLVRDCRDTKALIIRAEGVSTPSQDQQPLSDRELAEVSARRRARMAKPRR